MDSVKTNYSVLSVVHKIEDWILITAIAVMVVLSAVQILLRNLFDSGLAWISPLLGVLVLWVGLLGAMVATRQHAHIKINVLSSLLPQKFNSVIQVVVDLFSSTVMFVIAYYSVELVRLELESPTMAFANVPVWAMELILPASFGLIGLRFLVLAVTSLIHMVRERAG